MTAAAHEVAQVSTGRTRRRWLSPALDLLFPPCCAACEAPLESSLAGLLCSDCQPSLVDLLPACSRCGMPAGPPTCPHCAAEKFRFESVVRLGRYESLLRKLVLRAKLPREHGLATALGELLAATRGTDLQALKVDAVVPIPMHWSRKVWRGANSAEIIAQRIAVSVGVPLAGHLLARRRRTAPQAELTPPGRKANVRGAFKAASHRDLPGARILLVDDIMTTGATVNEAARMLLAAGAASVCVAVLARAEGLS